MENPIQHLPYNAIVRASPDGKTEFEETDRSLMDAGGTDGDYDPNGVIAAMTDRLTAGGFLVFLSKQLVQGDQRNRPISGL